MTDELVLKMEKLAERLLAAAEAQDQAAFDLSFAKLERHRDGLLERGTPHPVVTELIADFSDDFNDALKWYEIAYTEATEQELRDYQSSSAVSAAQCALAIEDQLLAQKWLARATESSKGSPDKQLLADIDELLSQVDTGK